MRYVILERPVSPPLVSIAVLVALFVLATARGINLGVPAFAAAFGVGLLSAGMTEEEVFAGFPADIFLILVGLTFVFGFAQCNGSLDLLVRTGMRLVRGRIAAAPWIFFALTAALMSVGALFAVAIIAPLAIPFARRYRIDGLMMGMMVVHGALAGAFSPISVYGAFVNGYLRSAGLPVEPLTLFAGPLLFNTVVAVAVYLAMGGRRLLGVRATVEPPGADGGADGGAPGTAAVKTAARSRSTALHQAATLTGIGVLAVGAAVLELDTGVLAIAIGAVLALLAPGDAKRALAGVSWSTVVLICGVLTYVHVLETAGTVDYVSAGITAIGAPLLAVLLLCYLAGTTSALASSLGIIGVAIPLAVPLLEQGAVDPIGFTVALAIAATVVDVSPFSTNGALVLANVADEDRDRYYRRMLVYAGVVVAAGPGLAWLVAAVPLSL